MYGGALRDGRDVHGVPEGRQETLRQLLETETDLDAPIGRDEVLHLAKRARHRDEELAASLERIAHLEALFAPAASLFQHLLARHGQRLSDVASEIQRHWDSHVPNLDRTAFADLLAEVQSSATAAVAACMDAAHAALSAGDYSSAIEALIAWNQQVMQLRGGAPWVRVGDGRRIDIRYRGAEQQLPAKDELPALWVNSYFIDSLKSVTRQLQG